MKKVSILFFVSALLFSACKTDFKLTAPWKEQMVIFGLLNQSDTVQYIRINKTYLGEGNAYTMGAISDSINYKYLLNVTVSRSLNGVETNLPVDTTTSLVQDPGAFASSPNQILYRIKTPLSANLLNEAAVYKLTVMNPVTGYTAKGSTSLVKGVSNGPGAMSITAPYSGSTSFNFYNTTAPFKIEWLSGANAKVYEPILRFHYTEYSVSGTTNKYVDKDFGQISTVGTGGGEDLYVTLSYSDFLSFLNSSIADDPTVGKRVFGKCDIIFYVASDEFNTYMEVNKPVSSITGDKPIYTNITNGIGLFSARYTFNGSNYSKPLNNQTVTNASIDPLTCHLHFADQNGVVTCP
ncbi:MAG TPA: hypothetical protein VGO45_02900 [Bacteroidia bacterium]|nr:hypothetical protein [Bacteroidia bacterium]